jgi:hypothetical protein
MENTITLFNITLWPIHLQFIQVVVTAIIGIGLLRFLVQRYNEWRGRAYDRFSISRTSIIEKPDGTSQLEVRNIGPVVRLEDAVRGRTVRNKMIAVAKRTTGEQPFVVHYDDADAEEMFEAVRDAISWISADGELAAASGISTISTRLVFAITAVDAGLDNVSSFKVHLIEEKARPLFAEQQRTFSFENGKDHTRRIGTIRAIAIARLHNKDERVVDGRSCRILSTFILKVRR